ncbi:uncharacterized protein LOC100192513 [Zea mays]|jgi:hypothetical protein|uniref:Uncharacterized protein n=1 Tax=Zea mays TaxID=4577 RepID=B4FBM5_MAIZE|nr:uncharacterized protein LOC100192513 [Zea mays]ACF79518.1 unknown [Zea mays]|eukprot:NP_001131205.1 uncharacterized protein LOC100192513 [Zea mays]
MHAAHTGRGHLRARQKHRCTTVVPTLSFINTRLVVFFSGMALAIAASMPCSGYGTSTTDPLTAVRGVSETLDFISVYVEVANKAPRKSALLGEHLTVLCLP